MCSSYVYDIYNKNFSVLPLTNADKKILENLNNEVENYFVDYYSKKECYRVYVISGSKSEIILNMDDEVTFLKELNSTLNQIYNNLSIGSVKWKRIVEKSLMIIDEKSGLFKIKEADNCFVIITDYFESYGQMYKVHVALESLLVYLLSYEKAIIFHSSCAGLKQEHCNLFIGKSGMGKSTIAKIMEENGGYIIDDEKNIVVMKGDRYYVYSGQTKAITKKFNYKYTEYGKIDKIYFLHQSSFNYKRKVNWNTHLFDEVLKANMQIGGFRQGHPLINRKMIMDSITNLLQSVPVYDLYFSLKIDVESMFICNDDDLYGNI